MAKTTVVNIKFDEYDVYIGRPGNGMSSKWGNPHHTAKYATDYCSAPACKGRKLAHMRSEAIRAFEMDFLESVAFVDHKTVLRELAGKRLGCFCAPKGGFPEGAPICCHGQVIANWINDFLTVPRDHRS